MTRELIVHIGLPKTGSSAIQTVLAKNRPELLARGLDYLPISEYWTALSGRTSSGNGLLIARSMLLPRDMAYIDRCDARVQSSIRAVEDSEAPRVLLSSEFFSFATEAGWRFLKELADRTRRDLRIVAAVRNPQDMMSATLVQLIRNHGLVDVSPEHVKRIYASQPSLKYFAFFSQIEVLTGARMEILSYDRARQTGQLMHDFFSHIGVDAPDVAEDAAGLKANVTPSPEAVAFARDCNIRKLSHPLINSLLQRHPSPLPWTMIGSRLSEEIDRFFAEDHEKFIGKFARGQFFAQPNARYIEIERCDFRDVAMLRSASLILSRIGRRGSNE